MLEEKQATKAEDKVAGRKNASERSSVKDPSVLFEQDITLEIFEIVNITPRPGSKRIEVFNAGPGEVVATTDMFVTKVSLKSGEKKVFDDVSVLSLMAGSKPRVRVSHLR